MTVMTDDSCKNMGSQNTNVFDPFAWAGQTTAKAPLSSPSGDTKASPSRGRLEGALDELARATAVARELISRNANIAESYADYVRLGFALANGLGSDGRDLYHMLCAHSTKYRYQDCESKWQECLSKADGRTSIATFYHMARQAGVDISAVVRELRRNQ